MGFPREIGREFRWEVAWEHTMDGALSRSGREVIADAPDAYVVVESARRFALIHAASGEPRAAGLKTEMFRASPQAFINQAPDAPRWAVQSWNGDMLRVVPRRGVPRLHGDTLLQFDNGQTVYGDVVTSGERWSTDLPQNSTVYHSTEDSNGTKWLAVGTIDGTVLVTDGPGGREWAFSADVTGSEDHNSPVYGVHVARVDHTNVELPQLPVVFVVQGMRPQTVNRIELIDGDPNPGETSSTDIGEIPAEFAERAPHTLTVLNSGHLIVGLKGGLFVADLDTDDFVTVPIPELRSLSDVGGVTNGLVIATGTGESGSVIMVGNSDLSAIAYWELADASPRAQVGGGAPVGNRIVVQQDDRVIGLEITL